MEQNIRIWLCTKKIITKCSRDSSKFEVIQMLARRRMQLAGIFACMYISRTDQRIAIQANFPCTMHCVTRNSMDITMTTSASVDSPSNQRSPVQTTSRPAAFHECKQPLLCQPFNRRSQWRQSAAVYECRQPTF